tara:strand:- start:71748 stop:72632 length:885 start_codon:yes stop_codon:yes gene_type:complete
MSRYLSTFNILTVLATCWLFILLLLFDPLDTLIDYGGFALLGVVGALFANSTGAGGGVIFVPFFNHLNFDANTTVATSFAIQCCGMTAGAIAWWVFYRGKQTDNKDWSEISRALKLTIPFSILGIVFGQAVQYAGKGVAEAEQLHLLFGGFSILLSLGIFASIPLLQQQTFSQVLSSFDRLFLPLIALVGGGVTAYLSIGVGELVAVFLIMRRFNVTFSIAVAVILSAFSVWSAILFHVAVTEAIYWPIVLFAGAGAIIGGTMAKYLVLYFSPRNLKIFFATWVFLLGLGAMPY